MNDPGAIVAVTIAGCTAAVFVVKAIASGVLRYQENELKYKNGAPGVASDARLQRIEQAVDAIAVEIERISENQRFTTKLLSERPAARLKQPDDLA